MRLAFQKKFVCEQSAAQTKSPSHNLVTDHRRITQNQWTGIYAYSVNRFAVKKEAQVTDDIRKEQPVPQGCSDRVWAQHPLNMYELILLATEAKHRLLCQSAFIRLPGKSNYASRDSLIRQCSGYGITYNMQRRTT